MFIGRAHKQQVLAAKEKGDDGMLQVGSHCCGRAYCTGATNGDSGGSTGV